MSEKKHTPGEWTIDVDHHMHGVNVLAEDPRRVLAVVAGNTFDERKANGALIAAAPDMLAELETLHETFLGYVDHHFAKHDDVKAMANLVIAKRIDALLKKASP